MNRNPCLLFWLFFISIILRENASAQMQPLPPLHTNPVWEVQAFSSNGQILNDTITYGERYCRCGHDYVGIVLNGREEVLYMRQTQDQAYYLLDIEDCGSEKLLYDYSNSSPQIYIPDTEGIPDSFALYTYHLSPQDTVGIMQLPGWFVAFDYIYANDTFPGTSLWRRGVGDYFHPFYPLFNHYNHAAQPIVSYGMLRLTVDHLVWYQRPPVPVSYDIVYVDADAGAGVQDGTTWANAYTSLQPALQAARPGAMVWVAEGVYTPGSERRSTFVLRNKIKLYGGFVGTETHLAERGDPTLHPTVLSGDIGLPGDSTDNTVHVMRIQEVQDYAVLDGFTIRGGYGYGGSSVAFPFTNDGGGILLFAELPADGAGSMVMRNVIMEHNAAPNGACIAIDPSYALPLRLDMGRCTLRDNTATVLGVGLYIPSALRRPVDVFISDCEFRRNSYPTGEGGGIYDYCPHSNWRVVNTVFADNGTPNGGGGAGWFVWQSGENKKIQILGCEFSGNYSPQAGAAFQYVQHGFSSRLDLSMEKTRFYNNRSFANEGAGIAMYGATEFTMNLSLKDCEFTNNTSRYRGAALAIRLDDIVNTDETHIDIDRCVFNGNLAQWESFGGALQFGLSSDATLGFTARMLVRIRNSLFSGNKGAISQGVGNGAYRALILDTISNCTFVNNGTGFVLSKTYDPAYNGVSHGSYFVVQNSILWEPEQPLQRILLNGYPYEETLYAFELDHTLISVDSCYMEGGEAACHSQPNWYGQHPRFAGADMGDYRLSTCSPFINKGMALDDLGTYDLNGKNRLQENLPDLGAYETGSFSVTTGAAVTDLLCAGDSTGLLSLNTLNARTPITYTLLATDGGAFSSTDGTFGMLPAGTYRIDVEDAQACTDTLDFNISAPPPLVIHTAVLPYIPGVQAGWLQVDSVIGGTPPYQLFFQGEAWDGTPIDNLLPGLYLVGSLDSAGCQQDTVVEVELINSTSLSSSNNSRLLFSPNPVSTNGQVRITLDDENREASELEIRAANGQVLTTFKIRTPSDVLYFTPRQSGVYIVLLKDSSGRHMAAGRFTAF